MVGSQELKAQPTQGGDTRCAGAPRGAPLLCDYILYNPVNTRDDRGTQRSDESSGSVVAAAKSKDYMAAPTGEDNLTNDEDSDGDGGGEVQLKRAGRAKAKAEAARVAEREEEEKTSGGGEGGTGG